MFSRGKFAPNLSEPPGYVQKILQARKEEGYGAGGEPPNEKDFDRGSPVAFEPINRLGRDPFMAAAPTDEIKLENNGLRALRKPKREFGFKKLIDWSETVNFRTNVTITSSTNAIR